MSSVFEIKEHTLECQHIREYARATANSQEAVLHLAVKQYIPRDNLNPEEGDVTIIAAHANGFPKELYEPLWEDLHARSKNAGFRIRSIWIADVAQQGRSGVLNETLLGDDPSWMDHARDLLHLTNTFRSSMPRPLMGIGHSFGAATLTHLSLIHPRLLSTLVLLDPVIQSHASTPIGPSPAQASTFRRDLWPSRAAAEEAFRKSKFYQSWDARVLDRWCQYGVRETPTLLYPNAKEQGNVTLLTTKAQECFTFLRPSWEGMSPDGKEILDRELLPDLSYDMLIKYPLYRPEPPNLLKKMPEVRPSVLFVFGEKSDMSSPDNRRVKMDITGTGIGGSGGAKVGRVQEVLLKDVGHLVAMEATGLCADAAAGWIKKEAVGWELEKKKYREWTKKSVVEKTTLSEEWQKRVGGPLKPRPKGKL